MQFYLFGIYKDGFEETIEADWPPEAFIAKCRLLIKLHGYEKIRFEEVDFPKDFEDFLKKSGLPAPERSPASTGAVDPDDFIYYEIT